MKLINPSYEIISDNEIKFIVDKKTAETLFEKFFYKNKRDEEQLTFVIPKWLYEVQEGEYNFTPEGFLHVNGMPTFFVSEYNFNLFKSWASTMLEVEKQYFKLIKNFKRDIKEASIILPDSLGVEVQVVMPSEFFVKISKKALMTKSNFRIKEMFKSLLLDFQKKI